MLTLFYGKLKEEEKGNQILNTENGVILSVMIQTRYDYGQDLDYSVLCLFGDKHFH